MLCSFFFTHNPNKENLMIVYGLSMKGRPEEVPSEIAPWLFERNTRYPAIDFTLECSEAHPEQAEEFAGIARQYSQLFGFSRFGGVSSVTFPYLNEMWHVRIVGGLDPDKNIVNSSFKGEIMPLGDILRNEIAGYSPDKGAVRLSEEGVGIPRAQNEPVSVKPTSMVPFPSDLRWTSEVSMSGKEFGELLTNPKTQSEAEKAIWAKDWKAMERLKEQQ